MPAAALATLAAPAVVAWSAMLDGFAIAVLPVAVLAATRRPFVALAVWLLAAPLRAGVPVDQLEPGAWTALPARLVGAMLQLAEPRLAVAGDDPWPLAAGLLLAGAAWIAAAVLVRRRSGAAFAAGAAPWVAAVLLHASHTAIWQGAAVVLAGLLLHAWPRTTARTAVALSVAVGLASGITAQAVSSEQRWFHLPGSHGEPRTPFRILQTEPTFQRLDRPKGAPMLQITASEPALWRLQVLDVFDGRGWRVGRSDLRLPEPAAQPVQVDVRVRGLRNDLVASPGAIERVGTRGTAEPAAGEAWRLKPRPDMGDTYSVDARVVRADAAGLRRALPTRDPLAAAYTQLGWDRRYPRRPGTVVRIGPFAIPLTSLMFRRPEPPGFPIDVPLFGEPLDATSAAAVSRSPYRDVAALARRLASGARTQWQVVARVVRYLQDENRFRYTTEVGHPGSYPLADFLLRTHAGYCQHFAGAAALLLRLVGVPARVVAGFATGVRKRGRFDVRDADAHDWIEVYFAGYGWVPFNPTPSASPAAIAPQLDLLSPTGGASRISGPQGYVVLGALLAAIAFAGWRRRRPRRLGDALGRLVGAPVPPSTTLAELRDELARTVGPRTSALAAEAERARFAPHGEASGSWTSARVAYAVARDVGPWRAVVLLAGAATAGARASRHPAPGDIA